MELAQEAASKILMAKHAEKDDPSYQALKGILTNGKDYLLDLVMPEEERQKLVDAEKQLAQAKKDGNKAEIDRLQKYVDEHDNIVTETTDKYAKNFETFEKKIAECDVKRPEGIDLKPDEEFNKSILPAQEEVAKLNARLGERLVKVGAGNYLMDDQVQSLNAAREEKLAEIKQMKAEYIQKLDEDVKAGRIYAGYKEAREKQLKDPNYKYDSLPDYFPQSDDMTEEQKAERQRDIVKFALKQNSEALGFVETKPEATAEQAPKQAEKQAEKQADFIGTWFEPGQEITKDVLLGKINEIDARVAKPLNSDNWLKNREEYEKNLREKDRLDVVFRGCWNLLPKENKEKVFAKLKDVAVQAYHDMLCAEGKSKESKKLGEEILKNKDDLDIKEIRERAEKFLTKQERNSPAVSSYEYTSVDNIIGKGPEVWKEIINNVPEKSLREFALKADNKTFAMETMTLEEAEEPRYESQIDMLKKTVDEMTYLGQKEMTSERKEELKKMLDNVKGMTAEINAEYGSELADIRLKREESDYGMNRTRTLIAYDNLKKQGFSTTNDGGSLILNGIQNEKVVYEKGMYAPKVRSLTPEAQQQFQKLKNFNFIIHPETQQKVKEIFAKFEEYGYDQANFEPEEQFKVYSMHKYARALEKFQECVASTDPADRAKTILAAGEMQVEYDKLKDLIQESGELFGVKEGGYYPGNLDCERNHALPPEFRNDLGGVSALNGLYILYRTVKERNISVDDVFKDPRAFMETITKESIDKMDINKTIKGKSGAEAMFDVCRGSMTYDKTATYGINRSLETLAKMEKDPAVREYNMANEQAFSLSYGFAHKMTEQRDTAIDVMQTHLDRFLMVDKPCEDASLAGAPSMDYNTIELIPSQEFDEVEYLMNNREDPKTFTDRVMNEGCKFIEMHVNDLTAGKAGVLNELPIERGFYAMQRAAIKFLAVRQDIDKNSEAYHTLTQLAERGSDFIKEQIVKLKDEGKIHLREDPEDESKDALKLIQDSNIKNLKTSQSLKDFQKDFMRSFGDDVRAADKTANRELKALKSEVERTQTAVNRNGSEIAQQQLKDAQARYNEAIANRKEQLLQDFRDGKITEDYLNRRNEQLDNGKFNDVPKMFEADQKLSKNEYLEQYVKNFNANNTKGEDYNISLDELSKEEKNELYQRYVENANRAKERFIVEKYLISEKKLPNLDQKTLKERIAAEDKRLEMMAKAYPEDAKEAVAKDKKIEEKAEEKAEEKVEEKKKTEEKVEEKTEEKGEKTEEKGEKTEEKVEENIIEEEELGEKISIELDDEPVDLNEDILNFSGTEKTLNKNELNV
ncbi:MAG: hypothetical protein IJ676_00920 [Clostridia bacterium]|nr:hypothetical protein [Clostridia bacterium]